MRDIPSFDSLIETMREADIAADAAAEPGDKRAIRKTLVRHIVRRVESDFPGRRFSELAILELAFGDKFFFAASYAEAFPHLHPSINLLHLDVASLQDDAAIPACSVDVVLSVDVLSCLAFGRGLDEEDVDEMRCLDEALSRILSTTGRYYDFMASAPSSQFVLRFVPDLALSNECRARPRVVLVFDPGQGGHDKTELSADEPLRFVTFATDLLRHGGADAAGGPLLQVAGQERPLAYEELAQRLGLLDKHGHVEGADSLIRKVLDFLFRDINDGGCPSNWELMSYVYVDPSHYGDVFEEPPELVPVFMDTFARMVQFLRESLHGASTYSEISLVDACRLATAANLPSLAVDHAEEDVEGSRGGCFKQFYHFAHADEGRGAPNGEGSFRCLVTTATAGGTGRPADGGDAEMQLG
mmetsp:Transcript_21695/g.67947  ORF Transcript_21695/g.67947 Transcript_21695/m.67947 type:complete len:414 (-) Transcript_21695:268-1509(-)